MNKYLLMCAAAALATTATGTAQAGSYSVHFATPSGQSYCDGEIGSSTASYAAGQHLYNNCLSYSGVPPLETVGVIDKGDKVIPGGKKSRAGNASMSDTSFAAIDGIYSEAILFDIETPIVAGGKWDEWIGVGDSAFVGNNGVLLAGQFTQTRSKKAESSVAKVLASLKAK